MLPCNSPFGHLNQALLQNKGSWARETAQRSTRCLHKESLAADKDRFQTLAVLETFHTRLIAQGAMISISAIINSSAITGVWLRAHLLTAGCRKHVEYLKTPWKNGKNMEASLVICTRSPNHCLTFPNAVTNLSNNKRGTRTSVLEGNISLHYLAPLPEIVPHGSQIDLPDSFKFKCHPMVINLPEVEGSANGIYVSLYPADLIESWKYSWERLYQVANLPQHPLQYFPIPPFMWM